MNLKISKTARIAVLLAVLAALMTSCGSISALYRDPISKRGSGPDGTAQHRKNIATDRSAFEGEG